MLQRWKYVKELLRGELARQKLKMAAGAGTKIEERIYYDSEWLSLRKIICRAGSAASPRENLLFRCGEFLRACLVSLFLFRYMFAHVQRFPAVRSNERVNALCTRIKNETVYTVVIV